MPASTANPSCLRLAFSRSVVLRGLGCALVVGTVLCAINHGECLLSGHFDRACMLKSLVTAMVPYVVSVASSVHALRQQQDAVAG